MYEFSQFHFEEYIQSYVKEKESKSQRANFTVTSEV